MSTKIKNRKFYSDLDSKKEKRKKEGMFYYRLFNLALQILDRVVLLAVGKNQ